MSKAPTLARAIDAGHTLTESQKRQLLQIFGKRCSAETRERLARRFALPLTQWPRWAAFEQIAFEYGGELVQLIASQDYGFDRARIRRLILNWD